MLFSNLAIIGCGGTGSKLVMGVRQIIRGNYRTFSPKVWFIDADKLERGNATRQDFHIHEEGLPKAEALKRRFAQDMSCESFVMSVNPTNIDAMFANIDGEDNSKGLIVIAAVDNLPTRVLLLRWLKANHKGNWLWISPGNTEDSGQVLTYGFINGEFTNAVDVETAFPEYAQAPAQGLNQTGGGCGVGEGTGTQSMLANQLAATLTLRTLTQVVEKGLVSFAHYFKLEDDGQIVTNQQAPSVIDIQQSSTSSIKFEVVQHEGYTETIWTIG
jgi:hypothetical protein